MRFLVLLVAALACSLAHAQTKYTLKFNHVLGPKEPYHEGFQAWAKAVSDRTKGGLTLEVFHSAQLGKEEDILEQIRQGANIGQNTDAPSHRIAVRDHVEARDPRATAVRQHECCQHAQQRRLACAVRAEETGDRAVGGLERDARDGLDLAALAERLREIVDDDHRAGARWSGQSGGRVDFVKYSTQLVGSFSKPARSTNAATSRGPHACGDTI